MACQRGLRAVRRGESHLFLKGSVRRSPMRGPNLNAVACAGQWGMGLARSLGRFARACTACCTLRLNGGDPSSYRSLPF